MQLKETKYIPLIAQDTPPAIWLNKETDDKFRPELKKLYYDPVAVRDVSGAVGDYVSDGEAVDSDK